MTFPLNDDQDAFSVIDGTADLVEATVTDTDVADTEAAAPAGPAPEANDHDADYRAAIRGHRYVYTCNAGWVDMTHAFTPTKRKELGIGARSLWNQILLETGRKSKSPDENGFLVVYRQDALIKPWLPTVGVTKRYFVQAGLPLARKEAIAMAIFQEVSLEFEQAQAAGALIGRGDSSFEPADLVSNLLGFYSTLRPDLTPERILDLCGKLSVPQSLEILRLYPGTFSDEKYKNRKFTPRFFPNPYCSNPQFPAVFQSIQPATFGSDFRYWLDLFDVYGGRPSPYEPKY